MTDKDILVPTTYTLPLEVKERIEQLARKENLNPSQLARRIFRNYLKHLHLQADPVKSYREDLTGFRVLCDLSGLETKPMNLIPTTLTAYQLTLTESEVQAAIANPASLIQLLKDGLASQLTHDVPSLNNVTTRKPKSLHQLRQAAAAIGKQPCPRCGQRIAAAYMNLHLRRKHAEGLQLDDEPV